MPLGVLKKYNGLANQDDWVLPGIWPGKRPSVPESSHKGLPLLTAKQRSIDLENARRKHDSQNLFQPVKLGLSGSIVKADQTGLG